MTYLGPPRESHVEDRLAGLAPLLLGWMVLKFFLPSVCIHVYEAPG